MWGLSRVMSTWSRVIAPVLSPKPRAVSVLAPRVAAAARGLAGRAAATPAATPAHAICDCRKLPAVAASRAGLWHQAEPSHPIDAVLAPLPLPMLARNWYFAADGNASHGAALPHAAVAHGAMELPSQPTGHASGEGYDLASTMKKRVTKMNKHKRRKRRKRDRLKKRQN